MHESITEIPYLYTLCYSHIRSYDFHGGDECIDGGGPMITPGGGIIFELPYEWAKQKWRDNWIFDYQDRWGGSCV